MKQRAGCQNYLDDKLGRRTKFTRMLSQSKMNPWNPSSHTIKNFTSNAGLKYFCTNFLEPHDCSSAEEEIKKLLTRVTYEAAVKDKLLLIPAYTSILKVGLL